MPYAGDLNKIPNGWALCNGQNGTPDLRDRFLTGAGSTYTLGATGGENFHTLTIPEMPSHNHPFSDDGNLYGMKWKSTYKEEYISRTSYNEWANQLVKISFSSLWSGYTGGSQAHENRPPFYAVYYIIKMA